MSNTNNSAQIERKVDELGRIVLPTEARAALGITIGTKLLISMERDGIFLKLSEGQCYCCKSVSDSDNDIQLVQVEGKMYCRSCLSKFAQRFAEINEPSAE